METKPDRSWELFAKHNSAVNMDFYYKPSLFAKFCCWVEDHNPFNRSVSVKSMEEYIKLPRSERMVFWFWYRRVFLTLTAYHGIHDWSDQREVVDTYFKWKYPVQYIIRDFSRTLYFHAKDVRSWISNTVRPRQKWLTKQIPKSWSDKPWLITELNFAMVVHFVDGERAFNYTDWERSGEGHSVFAKQLKECYDYIKTERPALQLAHENSYPDRKTMTGDFATDYAENTRLELLINDTDTKWLVWIVTNRDYMWT